MKLATHATELLSEAQREAIFAEIPEPKRGIFLAMGYLGLRHGEARALNTEDYQEGWLQCARGL